MPYQSQLASVVVESTFNWYWSVDGLQAQRFRVHLANTTATEQYDSLKHRGDESDASHLAHVFRLGLLPTGHIMPKEQRAVRDLARKCMQLVQQRSTHILSIETQMDQQRGAHLSSNLIKKLSCSDIDAMGLEAMASLAMKANVSLMQSTDQQIDLIEKALASHCRHRPGFPLLMSVAGIDDVLATVILLETGAIERFKYVGNYVSYCRCIGSIHTSNGKKKGEEVLSAKDNPKLEWRSVAVSRIIAFSTIRHL